MFEDNHWRIEYRRRSGARWSAAGPAPDPADDIAFNPFAEGGVYNTVARRRYPVARQDGADPDAMWLFWLEDNGAGWQLRYNRRAAGAWGEPVAVDLPGATPQNPAVLIGGGNILVFWTRFAPTSDPAVVRQEVAYRVKQNIVLDANNWSGVNTLPKDAADDNHHDDQADSVLTANGVEVFWSSNRGETGWAVWHSVLEDFNTNTWSAAQRITGERYTQRGPTAFAAGDGLRLLYRASRHIVYNSLAYRATETFDERYAGSTTLDVRHQRQIELRESFDDPTGYTYDTGEAGVRDDADRIARDTVGAFVQTDTLADNEIADGIARLRSVIGGVVPITDRIVYVPVHDRHTEYVYHYGLAGAGAPRYIAGSFRDEVTSVAEESALDSEEDFSDELGSET